MIGSFLIIECISSTTLYYAPRVIHMEWFTRAASPSEGQSLHFDLWANQMGRWESPNPVSESSLEPYWERYSFSALSSIGIRARQEIFWRTTPHFASYIAWKASWNASYDVTPCGGRRKHIFSPFSGLSRSVSHWSVDNSCSFVA